MRTLPKWHSNIYIVFVYVFLAGCSALCEAIEMAGLGVEGLAAIAVNVNASYRVSKIPSFWKVDPRAWFAIADASFRVANIIVNRTKVDCLIAMFDNDVVSHVIDLLTKNRRRLTSTTFSNNA